MNNAQRIFPVSSFTRQKLVDQGIDPRKIIVVPNGIDPKKFSNFYDPQEIKCLMGFEGRQIILTVSNLVKRKGHRRVIKAIKELKNNYPNILYLIIGMGPEEKEIIHLVDKEDLSSQVLLLGRLNDEELVKFYNVCDVFVLVSANPENERDVEGFGIVYLEANACGKPVVGGNLGGERDAILDGVTGLLVNPYDVSQIAYAIRKLLDDKKLAAELGQNGRQRAINEFSWENAVRKIVKELQGINANDIS